MTDCIKAGYIITPFNIRWRARCSPRYNILEYMSASHRPPAEVRLSVYWGRTMGILAEKSRVQLLTSQDNIRKTIPKMTRKTIYLNHLLSSLIMKNCRIRSPAPTSHLPASDRLKSDLRTPSESEIDAQYLQFTIPEKTSNYQEATPASSESQQSPVYSPNHYILSTLTFSLPTSRKSHSSSSSVSAQQRT